MINVLIADDNSLIRDGLRMRLMDDPEIIVTGMAEDGRQAVKMCREKQPDIVLMDINMPNMDGLEATRLIRNINKDINIIILTSYTESGNIQKSKEYRCNGFIYKDAKLEDFVLVIKNVYHGFDVWSKDLLYSGGMIKAEDIVDDYEHYHLTEKEVMLIKCKVRCLQYSEIARELNYSEAYVRQMAVQLKEKLSLQNILELAVWGAKRGL